MRRHAPFVVLAAASVAAIPTVTGPAQVIPKPGQPTKAGKANTFEVVGDSGVSAQQLFLGMPDQVYIIDKVENNPVQVAGHPAWATMYNTGTNRARPMDIETNSFCAGGGVLGNGTWLNVGGNQPVGPGGATVPGNSAPYQSADGGFAMRLITPKPDGTDEWVDDPRNFLTTRRWYPTLETLSDGTMIIIGGNMWGGFVNGAGQNNPTYEFFPSKGDPIDFAMLRDTLPANLYPLTWLLPSDVLFIQTNLGAAILDYKKNVQSNLDNIPHAVRTYPASAGTAMLPLTPANNWTATMLFCGGSDLQPAQWTDGTNKVRVPGSSSCVSITPDVDAAWKEDDDLPAGRVMANMILLPDGNVFLVNGANTGVAGYGNDTWAVGHSYADDPLFKPLMYNPRASAGNRWSSDGMPDSTVARMYHSSATLLPDGSVFISGSNPNPDYITTVKYPTEYKVERFYPWYYDKRRPEPVGLMDRLEYGGAGYDVTLSLEDLGGNLTKIQDTKAVVVRTGFSTHSINFGMRYVELETSYTVTPIDGTSNYNITLHVAQLPPNPAILAPGPAFLFIVVDGVPSIGQMVMVGSGKIGEGSQVIGARTTLPASSLPIGGTGGGSGGSGGSGSGGSGNGASGLVVGWSSALLAGLVGLYGLYAF